MSIFQKLKKAVSPSQPVPEHKAVEASKVHPAAKAVKREGVKAGAAWKVLKKPHVSEKAAFLNQSNQYVFDVYPGANKIEVKKAVEGLYGVSVKHIRVVNVPPKKRRLGRSEGFKAGLKTGWRKAIVTLEKGQTIEIMPH